jgi:hypothetical protein
MRQMPLILMLGSIVIAGCTSHPADSIDCALGVGHSDCAPDTLGYKVMAEQKEAEKTFATIDDARCMANGANLGSQAYDDCRRRATGAPLK